MASSALVVSFLWDQGRPWTCNGSWGVTENMLGGSLS